MNSRPDPTPDGPHSHARPGPTASIQDLTPPPPPPARAVRFAPPTLRWLIWIAIIVLAVVPWMDLQDHPHWWRVGWLPFWSPPVRWRDILINTALYMPLGLFSHRPAEARRSTWPWAMLTMAFALSIVTEASQSYSHSRFPSATDVTTNVLGAGLGWWFAEVIDARRAREATSPPRSTPR